MNDAMPQKLFPEIRDTELAIILRLSQKSGKRVAIPRRGAVRGRGRKPYKRGAVFFEPPKRGFVELGFWIGEMVTFVHNERARGGKFLMVAAELFFGYDNDGNGERSDIAHPPFFYGFGANDDGGGAVFLDEFNEYARFAGACFPPESVIGRVFFYEIFLVLKQGQHI